MQYNITLPTTEQIDTKKRDIDHALNYEYKEEDISRIIQEKDRFRAHPTNYAMKKTELMKVRH
jgi:RNA polymerase-associated protein RTF1